MTYFKIGLGVLICLAASRLIPHPPNFTSLLALSFYIPAIFGIKFIPIVMLCYLITDIFIGFHSVVFFTWGSVLLIGLLSKYFTNSFLPYEIGFISNDNVRLKLYNKLKW